jgi:glutamine synthetase
MLITSDGTDAPIEFEPREVLAKVLDRLAPQRHPPGGGVRAGVLPVRQKTRNGLPQFPATR